MRVPRARKQIDPKMMELKSFEAKVALAGAQWFQTLSAQGQWGSAIKAARLSKGNIENGEGLMYWASAPLEVLTEALDGALKGHASKMERGIFGFNDEQEKKICRALKRAGAFEGEKSSRDWMDRARSGALRWGFFMWMDQQGWIETSVACSPEGDSPALKAMRSLSGIAQREGGIKGALAWRLARFALWAARRSAQAKKELASAWKQSHGDDKAFEKGWARRERKWLRLSAGSLKEKSKESRIRKV